MSYLVPEDLLWQRLSMVVRDEGFELYDAERLHLGALRLSIMKSGEKLESHSADVTNSEEAEVAVDSDGAEEAEFEAASEAEAEAEDEEDAEFEAVDSEEVAQPRERVTSGDCSRICRRLMVVLQAEGEKFGFPPEPEIEVSSPGVNRSLRLPEHFSGAIGERVRLVVSEPINMFEQSKEKGDKLLAGGNTIIGQLADVNEAGATILAEGSGAAYCIPLKEVRRAQVDFKF